MKFCRFVSGRFSLALVTIGLMPSLLTLPAYADSGSLVGTWGAPSGMSEASDTAPTAGPLVGRWEFGRFGMAAWPGLGTPGKFEPDYPLLDLGIGCQELHLGYPKPDYVFIAVLMNCTDDWFPASTVVLTDDQGVRPFGWMVEPIPPHTTISRRTEPVGVFQGRHMLTLSVYVDGKLAQQPYSWPCDLMGNTGSYTGLTRLADPAGSSTLAPGSRTRN
jgi:hypothetical protein